MVLICECALGVVLDRFLSHFLRFKLCHLDTHAIKTYRYTISHLCIYVDVFETRYVLLSWSDILHVAIISLSAWLCHVLITMISISSS